jgi:hypothetical protein
LKARPARVGGGPAAAIGGRTEETHQGHKASPQKKQASAAQPAAAQRPAAMPRLPKLPRVVAELANHFGHDFAADCVFVKAGLDLLDQNGRRRASLVRVRPDDPVSKVLLLAEPGRRP